MNMNTSPERVDWLIEKSEETYDEIDRLIDGERAYRRTLRMGVNATAHALKHGISPSEIGASLLHLNPESAHYPGPLDALAHQYADIERATLDREGQPETDARHAIHLMKLAVPYAMKYYPHLDTGKIAAYSLSHDIVEAYAMDTPSLGITPEQKAQKDLIEAQAMHDIRRDYSAQWPEFVEFIEAYEKRADAEARFTKAFDKLDPGFTHIYTKGAQLRARYHYTRAEFMNAMDEGTARMQEYASDFPYILEDRNEISIRVANLAYEKAAL